MRTISQASFSLISAIVEAGRAFSGAMAAMEMKGLRRQKATANSIADLDLRQMRDLGVDLEGESMRHHPAFHAFEQERILHEAKQRALLFTLGTGGR